jgi:hypothetical protein
MVTSALFDKSFLSNGSTWQLPSEVPVPEEGDAALLGIGSLTEPESRLADAHEGEVENLLVGNGKDVDDQKELEERESLRGTRRTIAERRIQWIDRRDRTRTTPATTECFLKVQLEEMDADDARRESADLFFEDWFRFEQLMGNTTVIESEYRVFT